MDTVGWQMLQYPVIKVGFVEDPAISNDEATIYATVGAFVFRF